METEVRLVLVPLWAAVVVPFALVVLGILTSVLGAQLYDAMYCRPQEVIALSMHPDQVQGFLASNPAWVTAADYRKKLVEMGERAAPYTPLFHSLLAALTLDKPGSVIVFRALA